MADSNKTEPSFAIIIGSTTQALFNPPLRIGPNELYAKISGKNPALVAEVAEIVSKPGFIPIAGLDRKAHALRKLRQG